MQPDSRSNDIPLWPGIAPGSEGHTQKEKYIPANAHTPFGFVRNVTRPRLTPCLPDPARATGTGIIVCPGGAHMGLAIDHEGYEVADWLRAHGIAAFVLQYRLIPTPDDDLDFSALFSGYLFSAEFNRLAAENWPLALADGQQAVRIVRERAAEFGLKPDRIGMMGFSAGAHVTVGVTLHHDATCRPDFSAPIYGPIWEEAPVPADAPPLFIALASDDEFGAEAPLRLYAAWHAAKLPAELHVYAKGGHGFGMRKQGLPVDGWIERFWEWLLQQGG